MASQLSRALCNMRTHVQRRCAPLRLPNRPVTAAQFRCLVTTPVHGFRAPTAKRRQAAALPPPGSGPSRHCAASPGVRCLASKRDSSDKSWSEIASEAAQLGADLVKKVGSTVSKAVGAIVPTEERREEPVQRRGSEQRRRQELDRLEDAFGGGLVGGLMGRAVGSMLRSAAGALGEQLREAQEQVAEVQERAASAIEASGRLRQRMGGAVRVGPAVSQSSSTSVINGRASRNVTLIMPVVGPGGKTAQAQVRYEEGGSGTGQQLGIVVRLPSGEVVELDGGASPAGQVIDVDWRSVDDK